MTYNAVHAVDQLCKNLEFFVLQTGTNVRTNLARVKSTALLTSLELRSRRIPLPRTHQDQSSLARGQSTHPITLGRRDLLLRTSRPNQESQQGKILEMVRGSPRPDRRCVIYPNCLVSTILITKYDTVRPRPHTHKHDIRRAHRALPDALPLRTRARRNRRLPRTLHKLHPHIHPILAGHHRPLRTIPLHREARARTRGSLQHSRQRHPDALDSRVAKAMRILRPSRPRRQSRG